MPIPTPNGDEAESQFVARCMRDDVMVAEYPDADQRAAVCHRQFGTDDEKSLTHKNLTCCIKAASDGPDVYVATISTDSIDLDGEVMVPDGMDATDFEKRRTVFWNHDYNRPVGKSVAKLKRETSRIVSRFKFAERPANAAGEWFPDTVRALVDQEIIRGVSIGFRGVEQRQPTKEDVRKYGKGIGRVWSKWKLGEWSIAPFQCNPDATIEAVRKGRFTADQVKGVLGFDVPAERADPVKPEPTVKRIRLIVMATDCGSVADEVADVSTLVRRSVAKAIGLLYI